MTYPVVEDPKGQRYSCLIVVDSPRYISPRVKWFGFGILSELQSPSRVPDYVVWGYKEHELKDGSQMTTFSLNSLKELESTFYLEVADIIKMCPPKGWKLIEEDRDGNILEGISNTISDVSSRFAEIVHRNS